jgi:hypothetical protein
MHIFKILFVLVFVDLKNMIQLMHPMYASKFKYDKNILCDFLKYEWVNFCKISTIFSKQFLQITKMKGDVTDNNNPKCLIFVGTLLCKMFIPLE